MEQKMSINEMAKSINVTARSKGFYDKPRSFGDCIALMHSELSEALEADRNGIKEGEKGCVSEEFADTIIRILDTAEHMGLDIEAAILKKMTYNKTRPYRHGKKY